MGTSSDSAVIYGWLAGIAVAPPQQHFEITQGISISAHMVKAFELCILNRLDPSSRRRGMARRGQVRRLPLPR
jgi:hypothetical protein